MKSSFSKVFEKITRPATFLRVVTFGEITKEVDEFSIGGRYLLNTLQNPIQVGRWKWWKPSRGD